MPPGASVDDELPTVSVTWNEQGCLLEMTGRMTHQLLEHARDLVYAQTKPATSLTVRFVNTVLTRELVAMLIGVRRHLTQIGCNLHIDDPDESMPLASDSDGRLVLVRR